MKLLSKRQLATIPKLYQTEDVPLYDKIAYAKLVLSDQSWEWYVIEYDGQDTCFGLVRGYDDELGYFSLQELSEVQALGNLIERDRQFKPTSLQDLRVFGIERVVA